MFLWSWESSTLQWINGVWPSTVSAKLPSSNLPIDSPNHLRLPVKMAGSLLSATSTSCHRKGTCEKPLKVPWFLATWVWNQFQKLLLLNFLETKQVTRNLPKIHQEFMLDPVSMISWIIWKSNHLKTYPLNPPKLNESSQLRQSFQRLRYVWRLPRCCWLHSSTFGIRYQTHGLWNIWCKKTITHTTKNWV